MYLITGATGLIGRPLVETLLAQGVAVRAVTRDPGHALLPSGVEVVAPEAIHTALDGVRGLFVHPRAAKDDVANLVRLALSLDSREARRGLILG